MFKDATNNTLLNCLSGFPSSCSLVNYVTYKVIHLFLSFINILTFYIFINIILLFILNSMCKELYSCMTPHFYFWFSVCLSVCL